MSARTIQAGRAAVEAFLDDKQLNTDMKGMSTKLKTAGKAAAVAVAAAAAAAMAAASRFIINKIRENMQQLDEMGKRARTLDMRPVELMQLGYVARQSAGMAQEAFENAYERMQDSLQKAVSGAGKEFEILQKMGLDPETLIPMSATQRIAALADGLQNLETHGEQVTAVTTLFGRANIDMINVLKGGSQEVDKLTQKFSRLTGLDINASVEAIERANDALDDLATSWEAIFTRMTLATAEDLAILLDMMTVSVTNFNSAISSDGGLITLPRMLDLAASSAESLFGGLGRVLTITRYLRGMTLEQMVDDVKKVEEAANKLGDAFRGPTKPKDSGIDATIKAQQEVAESAEQIIEKLKEQIKYWGMTAEEIVAYKLAAGEAGDESEELLEQIDELRGQRALKELSDDAAAMTEEFIKTAEEAGKTAEELKQMRLAQMRARLEAEGNTAALEALDAAAQRAADAMQQAEINDKLREATNSVQELTRRYIELAEAMSMTEGERFEANIAKLEAEGADPAEIAAARAAFAAYTQEGKKADAQRIRDRQRTNQQIFDDEMKHVQELRDQRLLTEEEFNRERQRLSEQYLREERQRESQSRGGRALGGFDAGILGRQIAIGGGDVVEKELKEHTRELKENNQHLESIVTIGNNVIRSVNALFPALNIPQIGNWRNMANIPMFRRP